jgi:zinc transport system substrate-binding protein
MKNFKIILLFLTLLVSLFLIFALQKEPTQTVSQKPIVSVSTFALYDIVKYIAKDKVDLVNILPFGVDPHSFELTPKLMSKIEKSSIVFYSGAGLEPWIRTIDFKGKAIDMSKYVKLRELNHEEELHHHDDKHAHHKIDPHYWLDFDNMKKMSSVITDKLVKLQPKNKSYFLKNQQQYANMLERLDEKYKKTLLDCSVDTVILDHNAISYLAQRYNFNVESLNGLSPEAEPSAKDMQRVMKEISSRGISTLFFENFSNSKGMKSIANDMNVKLQTLQPLGNITADEAQKGLSYEDIMYINLKKLSKALSCK